jgi:hypothetical protein
MGYKYDSVISYSDFSSVIRNDTTKGESEPNIHEYRPEKFDYSNRLCKFKS